MATIPVDPEDVRDLITEYRSRVLLLANRRAQMAAMVDELMTKIAALQAKLDAQPSNDNNNQPNPQ